MNPLYTHPDTHPDKQSIKIRELKNAQKITFYEKIFTKLFIFFAKFYIFATGNTQMAKGMTANPNYSTISMSPLLALARCLLSLKQSVCNSVAYVDENRVSGRRKIPFVRPSSMIRLKHSVRFIYLDLSKDINPENKDEKLKDEDKRSLFQALTKKYYGKNCDIFDDLEGDVQDAKNGNNEPDNKIRFLKDIYQIRATLIKILLDKNVNGPELKLYNAIQNMPDIIDKIIKYINKKTNENNKNTLDEEKDTVYLEDENLVRLAKMICKTENDHKDFVNKNNLTHYNISNSLISFKKYIYDIATTLKQIKESGKSDAFMKILTEKIYSSVLMTQLADNEFWIKNKWRRAAEYILFFLFCLILLGNVAVFTIFTEQKGAKLLKKTFTVADKNLIWKSDILSRFLQSPPGAFTHTLSVFLFALSTILISVLFGGSSLKALMNKLLEQKNKFTDAYEKTQEERNKESKDWKFLKLIRRPTTYLYIAGGIISLCGSNMVFFNYIYYHSLFSGTSPCFRWYLMICIFFSTASLFIKLALGMNKKINERIKGDDIKEKKEKKGVINKLLTLLAKILLTIAIVAALAYILIVSDLTNASEFFKGKVSDGGLIGLLIMVGICTTAFNIVYAFKGADYIYEKIKEAWNGEKQKNKDQENIDDKNDDKKMLFRRGTFSIIALALISTMVLIALPSTLGKLFAFNLITATSLVSFIGYTAVQKTYLFLVQKKETKASNENQKQKIGSNEDSMQQELNDNENRQKKQKNFNGKRIFLSIFSLILCVEAVTIQQGMMTKDTAKKLYGIMVTLIFISVLIYAELKIADIFLYLVERKSKKRMLLGFFLLLIFNFFLFQIFILPFSNNHIDAYITLSIFAIYVVLVNGLFKSDKIFSTSNILVDDNGTPYSDDDCNELIKTLNNEDNKKLIEHDEINRNDKDDNDNLHISPDLIFT